MREREGVGGIDEMKFPFIVRHTTNSIFCLGLNDWKKNAFETT